MNRLGRVVGWTAAAGAAGLLLRRLRADPIDLAGRVVLITGGSRGLGLALARAFAAEGARIVICARDRKELEAAQADLEERGAEVLAVPVDVTDAGALDTLVHTVRGRFGGVDVLVNNAGVIQVGPVGTMRREDFDEALDVNLYGMLNAIHAVVPEMRRRGEGRIVNITSIGGKVAVPHLLPYDVSKFAAVGLSEGLRAELAREGIRVTTVVPGLMRTGSPVNAFFKGDSPDEYTWFSIGDALPLLTVSAPWAARRIVNATKRGAAEVTISVPAKTLRVAHALFPGLTADALGLVNRLLPEADGPRVRRTRGMQFATRLSPSPLTGLMNRAAKEYHQYAGAAQPAPQHARKVGLEREPHEDWTSHGRDPAPRERDLPGDGDRAADRDLDGGRDLT